MARSDVSKRAAVLIAEYLVQERYDFESIASRLKCEAVFGEVSPEVATFLREVACDLEERAASMR